MLNKADYYAFQRLAHRPSNLHKAGPWDVLLSAYDRTVRVQEPFQEIQAAEKRWIVHEEYGFNKDDRPHNGIELPASFDPPAIVQLVRDWAKELQGAKLCIDSTGFIRPHLLVLLWALRDSGVRSFDVLYSDPVRYVHDEDTEFSQGPVVKVEQIPGYEGIHRPLMGIADLLVIGAGYDYEQIRRTCDAKSNSKKYVFTGLPSLQPHMYQESVLRINAAAEWIGDLPPQQRLYASANHPFTVAQALHDLVSREELEASADGHPRGNLYLCPVGPKPHVLGFALYYLRELEGSAASIIYPFTGGYSSSTTEGLLRTWQYRIEL